MSTERSPRPSVSGFDFAAALLLACGLAGALAGCGAGAGGDPPGGGGTGGTGGGAVNGTGGGSMVGGTGGAAPPVGTGGAVAPGGTGGSTAGTGGGGGNPGTGGRVVGTGGAIAPPGTGGGAPATAEIWVGPNGVDTNPGTREAPLATLNVAHTRAAAGTTIWVLPGNYATAYVVNLVRSGTATDRLKIYAAPGGARPVFNFATQTRDDPALRGINIKGDYWHIKGIEIANAADNCINISGSNNTIESVVMHGCGDSGLQITVESASAANATRGANNTVLNCDSYDNSDVATGGENADGFAAKLYIGPGNVFRGCRAWNNADDGWDLFAANDVVVIDNCWAFLSGETSAGYRGPNADGNGFKLGGRPVAGDANMGGAVHLVTNSFAFENRACGYTRNNNPLVPSVTMSGQRANGSTSSSCLTPSSAVTFTMTGAQAKAAARDAATGNLPAIR